MKDRLIFCNTNVDDPTAHLPVTIVDRETGEIEIGHISPEKLYSFLQGNATLRKAPAGVGANQQQQRRTA